MSQTPQDKLVVLRKQLAEARRKDDFESCASLRDMIKELEEQIGLNAAPTPTAEEVHSVPSHAFTGGRLLSRFGGVAVGTSEHMELLGENLKKYKANCRLLFDQACAMYKKVDSQAGINPPDFSFWFLYDWVISQMVAHQQQLCDAVQEGSAFIAACEGKGKELDADTIVSIGQLGSIMSDVTHLGPADAFKEAYRVTLKGKTGGADDKSVE